jgi:hypothetical protein
MRFWSTIAINGFSNTFTQSVGAALIMLVRTQEKYEICYLILFNRFLNYAKISLSICYFWVRKIYLLNCYENFMVAFWMYVVATVIFIDLIMEF